MSNQQQIIYISTNQIQANPLQPRGVITPNSIMDLVDSIREHGILEPLVVAHTPAGYQIIAGERRWRAAKLAGLDDIPVIVKETSPLGMLEMALVENVQREDLNPLERARAFQRLVEEFQLASTEIAKRIGKSTPYVSNSLKLLELPDALKDGLLSGLIAEGHARALQAIRDEKLMVEAYKIILRESGSVRRAEDLARRMKIQLGQTNEGINRGLAKIHKEQRWIINEKIDKMEKEMRDTLGEKGLFKLKRTARRTEFKLTLRGGLQKTDNILEKIHKATLEILKKEAKLAKEQQKG